MEISQIYALYLECGSRVTTDSRSISGGEMFIALKGENFDGNEYALKAIESGARFSVVNAGTAAAESGYPSVIVVDDTFETLKQLANYHRNHCLGEDRRLPVIGLTGTNGKTTTKELLRAVLSAKYKVTATSGNLNNDIGVPLSLLKITSDTEIAVIEMGANHPDDIQHLVDVCQPDCGLITNVGKAHLLGFGSFEGVKAAKGQLYDYINAHGGFVFVNADDEHLMSMVQDRGGMNAVPYGVNYSSASLLPVTPEHPYLRISLNGREINTRLVGSYNAMNVMAALCVGSYFEVPFEDACRAIESYTPANSRSQMQKTDRNTLILDAYNANPSSMSAAIANFNLVEADNKLALLGDMRELGSESLYEHVEILKKIAQSNFKAMLVGEEFKKAFAQVTAPNVIRLFDTSEQLADYLKSNIVSDACVLVKGSRGIRMENAVTEL